jgi:ankyrin repeat protein
LFNNDNDNPNNNKSTSSSSSSSNDSTTTTTTAIVAIVSLCDDGLHNFIYLGVVVVVVDLKKLLRKQDKDRRTPLVYSIIRRNTPITKLLIAKKANINFANAEEVCQPNLSLSLSREQIPSQSQITHSTITGVACDSDLAYISLALISIACKQGWTPLMYAIFHGFREGVDLLLEAGANPNAESTNKRPVTPLLLACGLGDTPAVAKLLKRGANMSLMYNAMSDYFFNPLMVAIHSTDIPEKLTRMAIAEMLINEGVDIQRPRSDGITPLMACMDKCMFETAKELIDHAARCDKEVVCRSHHQSKHSNTTHLVERE